MNESVHPSSSPRNVPQRMIIAYGVARGMAYLHSLGVIDRDLKPANVFIDAGGFPRIGDLGWAKLCDPSTQDSDIRGSPLYRASELFEGRIGSDFAVGGYSFGILLWELITDRLYMGLMAEELDHLTDFQAAVTKGLRPPVEGLKPSHARLLQKCWGYARDRHSP
jgi:serine/threonine protein kinase